MKRKIKIFLAAYINYPNAQNINCEHIARYLDTDKFEVHAMYTDKVPIDKRKYKEQGIVLHRLIHHRYIWFWSKLFAMWYANADVYYMPKMEPMDKIFARFNKGRKKLFVSSIEGVVTDSTNNSPETKDFFLETMDTTFAISKCISESVKKFWNVEMKVLPLGVETVKDERVLRDAVINVVWIGNIKANKRPQYLIECAQMFPQLQFTMIGDGDMQNDILQMIEEKALKNVVLTGRISNLEVYEHLQNSDLLLMTSEYEGLPKVIQEAAQCRVPSIYIAENYSVDFIDSDVNGYAVESIAEMIEKIRYLISNPTVYKRMSENAYRMIQTYLWQNLIKDYEQFFIESLNWSKSKHE